jgi:hypothetical protein
MPREIEMNRSVVLGWMVDNIQADSASDSRIPGDVTVKRRAELEYQSVIDHE